MGLEAITRPLGTGGRAGAPAIGDQESQDLLDLLRNLDRDQLDELIKTAQMYGVEAAIQLAAAMLSRGLSAEFNQSEADGDRFSARGGGGRAVSNVGETVSGFGSEDLLKLLDDLKKKRESVDAAGSSSDVGGGSQSPRQPFDVYAVNAPSLESMY